MVFTCAITSTLTLPARTQAANGGYNLYWIDDYYGVTTSPDTFNTVKQVFNDKTYTSFGVAGSTYYNGHTLPILCVVADDGSKWLLKGVEAQNGSYPPRRISTDKCDISGSTSFYQTDNGTSAADLAWHGERSYSFTPGILNPIYAVDREGVLWSSNVQLPYHDIDFQQVGRDFVPKKDQGTIFGQAFALGKPRTSNINTIAQMPTTGAPEGLTSVAMMAIGLGLIGLSLTLMRRRV